MFSSPTAIIFANPTADLILVLAVVLLIFGPKRLPTIGRELGRGMREFKDSITGNSTDEEDDERRAIARASTQPEPSAQPAAAPAQPAAAPGTAPVHPPEHSPLDAGSERGA
jgi:sec-independent protein translocase protein TatA